VSHPLLTGSEPPGLWSDDASGTRSSDGGAGAPPGGPHQPRTGYRRFGGRGPLALLLVTSALLGGGASAGILAASGELGGGHTTTVIQRASSTTAGTASTGTSSLNADALYTSASAGVVDITAKGVSTGAQQSTGPFGQAPQPTQTTATGTGFEVDQQGHIVTAAHVVDGASSVTVKLADGTTRKATVLGKDDATDVAVLKIDPSGLTLHPLKLGSSASLAVGDQLAAIGDPFGYDRSLSTGIVSGLDRTIQAPNGFSVAHAIQTDTAMNPGNSGGPILDASGAVVGIADQIATDGSSQQSSGVGFAIPSDLVSSELSTLEAGKQVNHAYLGVSTSAATSNTLGVSVASVASSGPASAAGLRAGDVITKLGSTTINDQGDLVAAIAAHKPGDQVAVTVRRGSGTQQLQVTLGTQPALSGSAG
jgi:putative serine protease PepD